MARSNPSDTLDLREMRQKTTESCLRSAELVARSEELCDSVRKTMCPAPIAEVIDLSGHLAMKRTRTASAA